MSATTVAKMPGTRETFEGLNKRYQEYLQKSPFGGSSKDEIEKINAQIAILRQEWVNLVAENTQVTDEQCIGQLTKYLELRKKVVALEKFKEDIIEAKDRLNAHAPLTADNLKRLQVDSPEIFERVQKEAADGEVMRTSLHDMAVKVETAYQTAIHYLKNAYERSCWLYCHRNEHGGSSVVTNWYMHGKGAEYHLVRLGLVQREDLASLGLPDVPPPPPESASEPAAPAAASEPPSSGTNDAPPTNTTSTPSTPPQNTNAPSSAPTASPASASAAVGSKTPPDTSAGEKKT